MLVQVIPKLVKTSVVVAPAEDGDLVPQVGADDVPDHPACHSAACILAVQDVEIAVVL